MHWISSSMWAIMPKHISSASRSKQNLLDCLFGQTWGLFYSRELALGEEKSFFIPVVVVVTTHPH